MKGLLTIDEQATLETYAWVARVEKQAMEYRGKLWDNTAVAAVQRDYVNEIHYAALRARPWLRDAARAIYAKYAARGVEATRLAEVARLLDNDGAGDVGGDGAGDVVDDWSADKRRRA